MLAASATVVRVACANSAGLKLAFFNAASKTTSSICSVVIKTSFTASLIFCPCLGRNVGSRIITYLATSIALRLTSVRISACVNGPGGDNSSSTLRPSKISNLDKVSSSSLSKSATNFCVAGSSIDLADLRPANTDSRSSLVLFLGMRKAARASAPPKTALMLPARVASP